MTDSFRRVCVVGGHNSGKTLLLERLVALWAERGMRVVVLKHDGHADLSPGTDDWEKPNGDTVRLRHAGAAVTAVAGGGQSLLRLTEDLDVQNVDDFARRTVNVARSAGNVVDLVAAEGWKHSEWPKLVVVRNDEEVEWLSSQNLLDVRAVYAAKPVRKVAAFARQVYHGADIERLAADVLAWT
ncbi:molybdopterin-guanine dinucleotide biosynthesis protein B [Alicyclobacillus sp. ALC3]|uniref:molybdopterin-guanine dinucleotide biosynthesis protein B n=1 Tax=Alicyclobacillus sp. ALC3 TaxID=2796143 RepID=UPI0023784A1D|nr:molybdopterin-guanine dinucleotide biosynthesis protein MobB [Alicyclobacillus sp. ALC3]WDL95469.1 molybdopterin-guanine dinucleotide biosynthesis protein MobB [Alicyclobacillus sp. ALC3]